MACVRDTEAGCWIRRWHVDEPELRGEELRAPREALARLTGGHYRVEATPSSMPRFRVLYREEGSLPTPPEQRIAPQSRQSGPACGAERGPPVIVEVCSGTPCLQVPAQRSAPCSDGSNGGVHIAFRRKFRGHRSQKNSGRRALRPMLLERQSCEGGAFQPDAVTGVGKPDASSAPWRCRVPMALAPGGLAAQAREIGPDAPVSAASRYPRPVFQSGVRSRLLKSQSLQVYKHALDECRRRGRNLPYRPSFSEGNGKVEILLGAFAR